MEIPKKVGRYDIVAPLGGGGMGSVFKAWDPIFERHVALKTIAAQFYDDAEFRKRFHIEAKAAAQLKHPNIVEIYDWIEEGGRAFQVLELLEGTTLQEKIDADRKAREGEPGGVLMPLEEKLRVVLGVLSGLHRAHQSGIIHRDIKPTNVFVTSEGEAKILDFGLARIGAGTSVTTGALGTPGYMSPEQFAFEEIDHRTDIWSCGVLLYQLLSNRLPFPGREFNSIAKKVLHSDPETFEASTGRTPASLEAVLSRALSKDRNRRYPTAVEMAGDVLLALESLRHASEGDDVRAASSKLWETVNENRTLLESPLIDGMLAIDNALDSRVWKLLHSDAASVMALASAESEYIEPLRCRIEGLLAQLGDAQMIWSEALQLEKSGRLDEAISRAEDASRAAPGSNALDSFINRLRKRSDVERLFSEAQNLYRQGKLDESASLLDGALKLQPDNAGLRALAREVGARIEERKAALVTNMGPSPAPVNGERVRRTPLQDPTSKVEALFARATRLVEAGEEELALPYLNELLGIDPMHRAALELARRIERKRDEGGRDCPGTGETRALDGATKAPEQVTVREAELRQPVAPNRHDPRVPDLLRQARVFFKAKRLDDATKRIESLLVIDPENAEARDLLEVLETYRTMPWHRRNARRARKWIRSHPMLSAATAAFALVVLALSLSFIRTPTRPKGEVWIEIAPWAEIESVREKGRERTNELPAERATPISLTLTAGVYEIRFRNHLRPESPLVLEVEVLANARVELRGALSGFDHVPIPIEF